MLVPIGMMGLVFWGPVLQLRSNTKSHKHMSEEGNYEFGASGFRIERPSLTVAFSWSAVVKVVELKSQFLLFTTPTCFHVVPKRFLTPQSEPDFRELMGTCLAQAGLKIERV